MNLTQQQDFFEETRIKYLKENESDLRHNSYTGEKLFLISSPVRFHSIMNKNAAFVLMEHKAAFHNFFGILGVSLPNAFRQNNKKPRNRVVSGLSCLVDDTGLEPVTPCTSSRCSSQLS